MTPISVSRPGGAAAGRLFLPEGKGPFPLVVSLMDAAGLRPAMDEMAAPLVAAGFAVVQPDLYWRSAPVAPFDAKTMFSVPEERARAMGLIKSVTTPAAIEDIQAFVAQVRATAPIKPGPFSIVGYCMGGRLAFSTACALGSDVAAAASIHGGGLVTDATDSPHLGAAKVQGKLYFGVAGEDGSCTAAHVATLHHDLSAAGVDHELELFADARHGFAMSDFPVYQKAAADAQWVKVLALFRRAMTG